MDFEFYVQLALTQLTEMKAKAENQFNFIKKGEYNHQSYSIEAQILAPVLIVPQNILENKSKYFAIDLGLITIRSELEEF